MSEFDADAKKLTKATGDSYSQLGFMPNYHGFESTTTHIGAQFDPTYFTPDGKSNLADDPASTRRTDVAEEARRGAGRLRQAGEVPHDLR